jgi:hypothetical protein
MNKTLLYILGGGFIIYLLTRRSNTGGGTNEFSTPVDNPLSLTDNPVNDDGGSRMSGIGATIPAALYRKVDEINMLIEQAKDLDDYVYTYAGGTFPSYLSNITDIEIKGKFAYINVEKSSYMNRYAYFENKERFNLNSPDGLDDFKYHLNIIKRAFVSAIKKG